ncbi:MAG: hypothetical protein HY820_42800 [Acidobacteria bacterium]|nr:hypothetical protein [Acidobacteriota bacterium]
MAVYKRSYKAYTGHLTPEWSRWIVIPRYAWQGLFRLRLLTIFYVLCFFYPLGCAVVIYLNNNLAFIRQYMPVPPNGILDIGNKFFLTYTVVQCTLAFILTAFIGPGLVSPDLANNALPLYFSRPVSRTGYVVGKMMVIAGLLSMITWIPGLMLFGLQASLADSKWVTDNWKIAWSIFFSASVWIVFVAMLSLALSAWVRWRIIAGGLMLVVLFVGAGLAEAIRQVWRIDSARFLDVSSNMGNIWTHMFDVKTRYTLTLEDSIMVLAGYTALCIWLLARKIKACEVIRG